MLFDLDIHLFYLEYVGVCIQKTLLIFFEIVFWFKLIFFYDFESSWCADVRNEFLKI
jgi:hypothetical protein